MIISSNTNLIYINKLDFDPLQNIIKKKEKLLFIFDKKLEKNKAFLKLKKFFAKNKIRLITNFINPIFEFYPKKINNKEPIVLIVGTKINKNLDYVRGKRLYAKLSLNDWNNYEKEIKLINDDIKMKKKR